MADPRVTIGLAREHGLSEVEYRRIVEALGRAPTFPELGVFSVMWSEHCSYKSSRVHLAALPSEGPRVVQGPGENAGAVDVGGGWAVVFKMESHNHPSFVEPTQGAATGVGGILRDVFTMGARPIASLDSLRFGSVAHPRTPYLVRGVVAGIGGYGNCVGVPTVGGDCAFDPCYDGNILVNAMALGVARADRLFRARAAGEGNPVLYLGSRTGRDGIHGASLLASAEFDAASADKRPRVQVGDPFMEKLLIEAVLELCGGDGLVGLQDMGAAGLTSSSVEMAARGGRGIELDLDRVPCREPGMTPYEVLLSESQERMLLVARRGREGDALAVADRWDLSCVEVGRVTDTGRLVARAGGRVVVDVPVAPLAEGLRYQRPARRPEEQDVLAALDPDAIEPAGDLGAALETLCGSANLCSREWIWRQYDHTVRAGTVVGPGGDAAVVRLLCAGGTSGIGLTVDVSGRLCRLDPREGARHAVAEAARNLACVGAEPIGVTDCLNFGNPERPEVMWQFSECVAGLADACRALAVPVVSGNVSFYNETEGRAIHPTPTVAMVGLLPDVTRHATAAFRRDGDAIALLGDHTHEIGGSEFLSVLHGRAAGRVPRVDLAREVAVQAACRALIRRGLLCSAHDCSEGGLAVALAECCLLGSAAGASTGARIEVPRSGRPDFLLFGEAPSRILVSFAADRLSDVESTCREHGAPLRLLGTTGGDSLEIAGLLRAPLARLAAAWEGGFARIVSR